MFEDPIVNAFVSLTALVALMGGLLLVVKKYAAKTRTKKNGGLGLEVISRIALQPKTHLYIVKAAGKILLIGANDHSVTALADLSKNIAAAKQKQKTEKKTSYGEIDKEKDLINKRLNNIEDKDSLSFKSFIASAFKNSS